MDPKVKHFRVDSAAGYGENMPIEVLDKDLDGQDLDPRATSFYFFDQIEVEIEHESAILKLTSPRINISPLYHPGAKIISKEDAAKFPNSQEILSYMEMCKVNKIILFRTGRYGADITGMII